MESPRIYLHEIKGILFHLHMMLAITYVWIFGIGIVGFVGMRSLGAKLYRNIAYFAIVFALVWFGTMVCFYSSWQLSTRQNSKPDFVVFLAITGILNVWSLFGALLACGMGAFLTSFLSVTIDFYKAIINRNIMKFLRLRFIWLVTLAGFVVIAIGHLLFPDPLICQANCDKILVGMTPEQVTTILGKPTRIDEIPCCYVGWYWTDDDGSQIIVSFDNKGSRVEGKHLLIFPSDLSVRERLERTFHRIIRGK